MRLLDLGGGRAQVLYHGGTGEQLALQDRRYVLGFCGDGYAFIASEADDEMAIDGESERGGSDEATWVNDLLTKSLHVDESDGALRLILWEKDCNADIAGQGEPEEGSA